MTNGSVLGCVEDLRDGGGKFAPGAFFQLQLFSPGRGQFIKLRSTIVLRCSPARLDPTLALETMERGIERALLHEQNFAGNLMDALRDGPAVLRLKRQRAHNHEVQRSLRKINSALCHLFPPCFYRKVTLLL